eukprot:7041730-Lingulodinium_polyedra.AAC.1
MEDNRLALHLPKFQAIIDEELDWVSDLSMSLWQELASIVCLGKISAQELRSYTLQAASPLLCFSRTGP